MGYSRFDRSVAYFVGYPDITKVSRFNNITHFAPKNLALYVGSDGVSAAFSGFAKLVTFRSGTGSYVDSSRVNSE